MSLNPTTYLGIAITSNMTKHTTYATGDAALTTIYTLCWRGHVLDLPQMVVNVFC
jgi:hypothetical protein